MYYWLSNRNMGYWILPKCPSLVQNGKTISSTFIRIQGNSLSIKWREDCLWPYDSCTCFPGKDIRYLLQLPLTFLSSAVCSWPRPFQWVHVRRLSYKEYLLLSRWDRQSRLQREGEYGSSSGPAHQIENQIPTYCWLAFYKSYCSDQQFWLLWLSWRLGSYLS